MKDTLALISGVLFFIGYFPYAVSVVRGKGGRKATWIIWSTLDVISLVGMYQKHTLNAQIIGTVMGAWIVTGIALKFAAKGLETVDKVCLAGAAIALVLWKLSGNATFGIVTCGVAAIIGSIPTYRAAWKDPSEENALAWTIFWVSCVFMMFAVKKWTLDDATQPVTFFAIETIMMGILFIRPLFRRPATQN